MSSSANFHHQLDRQLDQLGDVIDTHGYAIVPVGYGGCTAPRCCGPASRQPWAYTVGLWTLGLPELVVAGGTATGATEAIAWVVEHARDGGDLPTDERLARPGGDVKLVDVPEEWVLTDPNRLGFWFAYHDHRGERPGMPDVVQIVWADTVGHFPDDASSRRAIADQQPVLRDDPFSYPHVERVASRHRRAA